jgi:hypothetical protein
MECVVGSGLGGVGACPEIDEATEVAGLDDEHGGVGVDDVLMLHGVEIEDGVPGHILASLRDFVVKLFLY